MFCTKLGYVFELLAIEVASWLHSSIHTSNGLVSRLTVFMLFSKISLFFLSFLFSFPSVNSFVQCICGEYLRPEFYSIS